jgi:hypothetical protein
MSSLATGRARACRAFYTPLGVTAGPGRVAYDHRRPRHARTSTTRNRLGLLDRLTLALHRPTVRLEALRIHRTWPSSSQGPARGALPPAPPILAAPPAAGDAVARGLTEAWSALIDDRATVFAPLPGRRHCRSRVWAPSSTIRGRWVAGRCGGGGARPDGPRPSRRVAGARRLDHRPTQWLWSESRPSAPRPGRHLARRVLADPRRPGVGLAHACARGRRAHGGRIGLGGAVEIRIPRSRRSRSSTSAPSGRSRRR